MFPRRSEFRLAEVRFSVANRRYKATLTCISGHICDFAITPSPKSVAFADWDGVPTAKILGDPLNSDAECPSESIPPAWSEFTSQMRTFENGWQIYDSVTAYRITLEDGEFVILAERDGNDFILHRIEPHADKLFFLDSHDGSPAMLEQSLAEYFGESAKQSG